MLRGPHSALPRDPGPSTSIPGVLAGKSSFQFLRHKETGRTQHFCYMGKEGLGWGDSHSGAVHTENALRMEGETHQVPSASPLQSSHGKD